MSVAQMTIVAATQETETILAPRNGLAHHDPGDKFGPLPPELWPNIDHLITEDDEPVDSIGSEKQQRLLAHILFGWAGPGEGRTFAVFANVGLYYSVHEQPLVPDVMVSLDVKLPKDIWQKKANRTYLMWKYGKPPDLVIEIVSNKIGKEDDLKKENYARIGIKYYVIFDPAQRLSQEKLRIYELRTYGYELMTGRWMADIGLGLTFWQGKFEDAEESWLRWCDEAGNILLTGAEQAEQAQQQAEQERQRAEQAEQQVVQECQRSQAATEDARQAQQQVALLVAQLRALGVDPDLITSIKDE
ncbi:MAG: Uma2 family endonuclease [Caldilineaceae bacterium]